MPDSNTSVRERFAGPPVDWITAPPAGFTWSYLQQPNEETETKQKDYLASVTTQIKELDKPELSVPLTETFDNKSKVMGRLAFTVLGYNKLKDATITKLAEALHKLEIEILDQAQVDAYKLECQRIAKAGDDKSMALLGSSGSWNLINIKAYEDEIPEHVLNKAIQVKREVPEVDVLIDEFTVVPDPFLVVKLGMESYVIEVWNEPKFEGRLTK